MNSRFAYALYTVCFLLISPGAQASRCTYEYTVWNVKTKSSSKRVKVDKDTASLTAKERDPSGCTPCSEDQEKLTLSDGLEVFVCKKIAASLKAAFEAAIKRGLVVKTLVGYRSQMSRGALDADGNRTQLSNHAFGVAVDVNEEANGLYENCVTWSPRCHLRKAGPYRPGMDPQSLTSTSPLVEEMARVGMKWGGQIEGKQKDFMHFSPTGY